MSEQKPKLPWKSNCAQVMDADNKQVAHLFGIFSARKVNGDYIVAAVNCHDELLEALRSLVADCSDYEAWRRPCLAYENAIAAIAKSEGK